MDSQKRGLWKVISLLRWIDCDIFFDYESTNDICAGADRTTIMLRMVLYAPNEAIWGIIKEDWDGAHMSYVIALKGSYCSCYSINTSLWLLPCQNFASCRSCRCLNSVSRSISPASRHSAFGRERSAENASIRRALILSEDSVIYQ